MEKSEEEERISAEIERSVEEIFERVREVARENPLIAERVFKAVQSGYKRGRRRAYDSMRVRGTYSLPPKWKVAFEACVQYAYSRGWISAPSPSNFAAFCIRTVIQNLLRKIREEDAEIARKAGEEDEQIARAEEEIRS